MYATQYRIESICNSYVRRVGVAVKCSVAFDGMKWCQKRERLIFPLQFVTENVKKKISFLLPAPIKNWEHTCTQKLIKNIEILVAQRTVKL